MPALARHLRWYIAIRLVAIVSVLLPYGLLQLSTSTPGPELTGPPAPESLAQPQPARPAPEVLPGRVIVLLGGATGCCG